MSARAGGGMPVARADLVFTAGAGMEGRGGSRAKVARASVEIGGSSRGRRWGGWRDRAGLGSHGEPGSASDGQPGGEDVLKECLFARALPWCRVEGFPEGVAHAGAEVMKEVGMGKWLVRIDHPNLNWSLRWPEGNAVEKVSR